MLLISLTPTSNRAQAVGDIGTNRKQQTCPSRLEPKTGPISAAQAQIYANCEAEADRIVKTPGRTDFIDISSIQVDPKPRPATNEDVHYFGRAVMKTAVYDISGTAIAYSCAQINDRPGGGRPGKNCLNTNMEDRGPNNAVGICFKGTYGSWKGQWRCRLSIGTKAVSPQFGPPPN